MGQEAGFALGDALTAGLGEWKSSLARKFQERQQQAAIEAAKRKDDTDRMLALVRAEAQTHAADTGAGARRYAADAGYAGRTEAANTTAGSRDYATEAGERGRKYSADKGLEGRRYAADTGLKGANVRAGATVNAAKIGAGSRIDAANVAAGASDRRGAQSLYGTMFRPRPPDPMRPAGGDVNLPPNFESWMKVQGLPNVKPAGMGPVAGAGLEGAGTVAAAPKPRGLSPAGVAGKPSAKVVTSDQLDAFAKATKRTPQQAHDYAVANGWQVQGAAGLPQDDQNDDGFDDGTDDDEDDSGA